MEGIETLNRYGMEVASGIILGLDTDTRDTGDRIVEFIRLSRIPIVTINLLQALPKTPLWDRLEREGRLIEDEDRDSNVDFRLPYEQVVTTWRDCMGSAYEPAKLFARFEHQVRHTYANRIAPPLSRARLSWRNIRLGLTLLRNIIWQIGVRGDYRRTFWPFALRRLARGEIEYLIGVCLVAHHLILFARAASSGRTNASYYSLKLREPAHPMAAG
jgi:radical SAM superfamily enzyme YgiQ (UPF0313 family)